MFVQPVGNKITPLTGTAADYAIGHAAWTHLDFCLEIFDNRLSTS